ncbi:MAG: hypothetical protein JXA20_12720 [Spirochaetes bacterium]|nr:hypothetical protein [Spirochaetota bacterium]
MDEGVVIRLSNGCIETASKREYRRLMDEYFCSDGDAAALERRIQLLGDFIEGSDFRALRGSDPLLEGHNDLFVRIFRDDEGVVRYALQGNEEKR